MTRRREQEEGMFDLCACRVAFHSWGGQGWGLSIDEIAEKMCCFGTSMSAINDDSSSFAALVDVFQMTLQRLVRLSGCSMRGVPPPFCPDSLTLRFSRREGARPLNLTFGNQVSPRPFPAAASDCSASFLLILRILVLMLPTTSPSLSVFSSVEDVV